MTPHRSTATVPADGEAMVFDGDGVALAVIGTEGVPVGVGDASGVHAASNEASTMRPIALRLTKTTLDQLVEEPFLLGVPTWHR